MLQQGRADKAVLRQIDHLRGEIHEYSLGIKGQIRMLANTTAMTEFMPAVLSRYLASHPDVTVELRERLSYLVVKAVSEGSADIGKVYRLQAVSADLASANALCSGLKASGVPCQVKH